MSLNEQDIGLIIARVRQEIEARGDTQEDSPRKHCVVVLVPSFVPSPDKALQSLTERYGKDLELVFLGPVMFEAGSLSSRRLDWQTQPNELVQLLVNAQTLVLLAPGTGLLRKIGSGDEEGGLSELLMRRLLWGKTFEVLMDFEAPKFRRGTSYAGIAEAIDAITSMGVAFHSYRPVDGPVQDACVLVTEQDVVQAKKNGCKTITCQSGAIITPLAADTAKELQINIEYA